jgi:hypothetical protein
MGKWRPPDSAQPSVSMKLEASNFNNLVQQFIKGLSDERASSALVKIGLDLLAMIMMKNPVDTGRSRAAWYVSWNFLSGKTGGAGGRQPKSPAESAGYSKGSINAVLSGPNKRIEMINAVAYVGRLEYGWSKQAPYGMVRISMQMVRRAVPDRILKELKDMWKRDGKAMWTPYRASSSGPRA